MTTLTFGKYSGQSIESLKRIDPDYLRWGAQNLRSDKWRAEFTEVAATITMEDEAWAIVHESPDIDYYEALRHLRDEAVEREEEERIRQQQEREEDEIIARYAPMLGISEQKAKEIVGRFYVHWKELGPEHFSSREKYEGFRAMMAKIQGVSEAAAAAVLHV